MNFPPAAPSYADLEDQVSGVVRRVLTRVRSETPATASLSHPSRDPLHADPHMLGEFFDFLESRQCTMEPGKLCDRCDICTTRGF